jgi:O-antigen/teichoic acid export membrane protein
MGIIIRQSILSTVYSYIGIIMGFLITIILMPIALSKAEIGLVRIVYSISGIFLPLTTLGFIGAGTRLFPYFRNHPNGHNEFLTAGIMVFTAGNIILAIIILLCRDSILSYLNIQNSALLSQYFNWSIALSLFTGFFGLFDFYLRFMHNSVTGIFAKDILSRIFIIVLLGLTYSSVIQFDQFAPLYFSALCFPTLYMLFSVYSKNKLQLRLSRSVWNSNFKSEYLKISIITFIAGFSSQIILYVDQILVTRHLDLASNGVYTTMLFFGTVINIPTIQMYRISTTLISDAWKNNDLETIAKIYRKSCITLLAIGGLIFIIIIGNLNNLFTILPEYAEGGLVVIWIGIGKLFDLATGMNGAILVTSKYYYFESFFIVLLFIGTWWLNNLLIPIYGIEGSAMATALVVFMYNLLRTIFVWRKFKWLPFNSKNLILIVIIAVFSFLIYTTGQFHFNTFVPDFIIDFILRSILFSFTYILLIYKLRLSEDINSLIDLSILKLKSRNFKSKTDKSA